MYRLVPFRRQNRVDSFIPQAFQQLFNWSELSWQSFNVDVKETSEGYALQADLPGVAKENIKLSINDGYLSIGVHQEETKSEEQESYVCRERRQMSSQRSFYVGNISSEDVVAEYVDGVLQVNFPKANDQKSGREIQIQ